VYNTHCLLTIATTPSRNLILRSVFFLLERESRNLSLNKTVPILGSKNGATGVPLSVGCRNGHQRRRSHRGHPHNPPFTGMQDPNILKVIKAMVFRCLFISLKMLTASGNSDRRVQNTRSFPQSFIPLRSLNFLS
jgi:hypothetical protein